MIVLVLVTLQAPIPADVLRFVTGDEDSAYLDKSSEEESESSSRKGAAFILDYLPLNIVLILRCKRFLGCPSIALDWRIQTSPCCCIPTAQWSEIVFHKAVKADGVLWCTFKVESCDPNDKLRDHKAVMDLLWKIGGYELQWVCNITGTPGRSSLEEIAAESTLFENRNPLF